MVFKEQGNLIVFVHQKIGQGLRVAAVLAAAAIVAACGGGGGDSNSSGNADVRLINATLTHANLSLVVGSTAKAGPVATDTASAYASVSSGSPTLQVNDTATGSAVTTLSPSLSKDDHYSLVAYETGGVVRTAIISEEVSAPSSGTAILRVFDAAGDAGAVDVYVTPAGSPTVSSPTYTFASSTTVQESSFASFTPGTYSVRVTGAGNPADLRLAIPSITLASQGVATLVLTPTIGGTLVNAGVVTQRDTYTAGRNTSARVRIAAALTPGATVSATVGSTPVAASLISPTVGAYVVVPAGAAVGVTVNGAAIAAPSGTLAAGSDTTLVVYGDVGAATASLVVDDNRLPASTANLKLRLFNGIVGTPSPLTLTADFAVVATAVAPGAASGYAVIPSSTSVRLDVTSATTVVYSESGINVPGNAVYTLFMLGNAPAPVHLLRRDR